MNDQGICGGRLLYADMLRITATVAVIFIHVSASMWLLCDVGSFQWRMMCFYNSMCRWAVPVFVMLSGMFFLDPAMGLSLRRLYLHHILRLLCSLLFWAAVYAVFPIFLDYIFGRGVRMDDVSVALHDVFLNGRSRYHLWFLYMMAGLYIITPPLRIFSAHADRRDLEYFLLLCFIFVCIIRFVGVLFPECVLSRVAGYMQVEYVMGYTGFYVAGYYLKSYGLGRFAFAVVMVLGAAGLVVTYVGTLFMSLSAQKPVNYLLSYFSPNVAISAVAVFVLFVWLGSRMSVSKRAASAVSFLSGCTFGIYLMHDMFISLFMEFGFTTLCFNTLIAIPCLSVLIVMICLVPAALIKGIPVFGKLIV